MTRVGFVRRTIQQLLLLGQDPATMAVYTRRRLVSGQLSLPYANMVAWQARFYERVPKNKNKSGSPWSDTRIRSVLN